MRTRIRKRTIKRWLVFISKIGFLIGLVVFLRIGYKQLFIIKQIRCYQSDNTSCPITVQAEMEHLIGDNLLQINTASLSEKIEQSSPRFSSFTITKSLPAALTGRLQLAEELAQLKYASYSGYFIVLDNNAIVESTTSALPSLPIIEVDLEATPSIGTYIEQTRISSSLDLYKYLQEQQLLIRKFTIATDSARLVRMSDQEIWFDPNQDFVEQITKMQLIISQLEDAQPRFIDVRFEKPIVKYD